MGQNAKQLGEDILKTMKIEKYDVIRVWAMLLVVFGHIECWNMGELAFDIPNMGGLRFIIVNLTKIIYTFHMPLFFALSGAIYSYNELNGRHLRMVSLVKKKFIHLMLPYYASVILLLIPLRAVIGYYSANKYTLIDIVKDILLLQNDEHLWFLHTLFFIFVLNGIIEHLISKAKLKYWFRYLVAFLIYLGSIMIPDRYDTVLRYLFWFSLGGILEQSRRSYNLIKQKKYLLIYAMGIYIGLFYFTPRYGAIQFVANIIMTTMALIIVWVLAEKYQKSMETACLKRARCLLSKYSFAIYIYHNIYDWILVYLFSYFGILQKITTNISYFGVSIIKTLGVIGLSIVTSILVKKLRAGGTIFFER